MNPLPHARGTKRADEEREADPGGDHSWLVLYTTGEARLPPTEEDTLEPGKRQEKGLKPRKIS